MLNTTSIKYAEVIPNLPLAITCGEPAGIGPDLCLQLAQRPHRHTLVVLADRQLLLERAAKLGMGIQLHDYEPSLCPDLPPGHLQVLHIPLARSVLPGKLDPANSPYVLNLLRRAATGCLAGEFGAMVTAPVHKGVINEAGIHFTGHTEFLAELTHAKTVVMMLIGGSMRIALATTHLPLRDVPDAITPSLLENVVNTINKDLRRLFGISQPHILVAGLNPHAGENGFLGREEIDVMIPTLEKLRNAGINVSLPLPADTLFTPERLSCCDCILVMYHDQGLPVLKHASFGHGVNVSLGLPIIRASVDHGTALELAGSSRADASSLFEAIELTRSMVINEHAL